MIWPSEFWYIYALKFGHPMKAGLFIMHWRIFLAVTLVVGSCAGETSRYDAKACPFCVMAKAPLLQKGACTYCNGTKKCSYCKGLGKRTVVVPDLPQSDIKKSSYTEVCPHCNGTGVCQYCKGTGLCWACDGSGHIDSWDFYRKALHTRDSTQLNPGEQQR